MMRVSAQAERVAPQVWPLYLLATLLISLVLSAITPPFQAPDEYDHVKRAYMMGQGQVLLKSVDGSPSGGYLDSGLVQYMSYFEPLKGASQRKVSADELQAAGGVKWSGQPQFQTAVGTAYYFPLMYAPQAVGLGMGKALGMSVGKSYRLARLLEWMTCGVLLLLAFRLHRPSAVVLALLALPMNLFLFGAAVLDPMATAVALLGLSAFMRIATDGRASPPAAVAALHISVLLVCACRANMLPMLLLPFVAAWLMRERRQLYIAIAISVFVLAWTLFTVKTTVYPASSHRIDHAARLLHLLTHPGELSSILFATWTNAARMSFYAVSFIGVLGWLDASFTPAFYHMTGLTLVVFMLLSLNLEGWRTQSLARWTLVVVCLASVLMTFLALLVQWTDPASTTVDGVQGRYLLIPGLCLVMALTANAMPRDGLLFRTGHALAMVFLAWMAYASSSLLLERYHTGATQSAIMAPELKPSPPLTPDNTVPLHFLPAQSEDPAGLKRISIRFGTYMTTHAGQAELRLWTQGGERLVLPFELSGLTDNGYAEFKLDGKAYVGGEIAPRDGSGVSVWESHSQERVDSCVLLETESQDDISPWGCPEP